MKLLEQFSIECRETKSKAITLTNHNRRKQQSKPIGFGSTSDSLKNGASFFMQSQSAITRKHDKRTLL